jgi:hypothetical protein
MVKHLRDDFDLLFGAVDLGTGELARGVLAEQGMPSTLHSQGFEADASLGAGSRWFQLFVPKGSKKQARLHLSAAWGNAALAKLH